MRGRVRSDLRPHKVVKTVLIYVYRIFFVLYYFFVFSLYVRIFLSYFFSAPMCTASRTPGRRTEKVEKKTDSPHAVENDVIGKVVGEVNTKCIQRNAVVARRRGERI